jgi:hypothetical protein
MKHLLFTLPLVFSTHALAAPQLICSSTDGSQVRAEYSDSEGLTNVRIHVNGGKTLSVPQAHTALIDLPDIQEKQKSWKVKSLVISEFSGRILVVVASDRYIDSAGTSTVQTCEVRN